MPSLDLRSPVRVLGRAPDLRLLLGAGLVSMTGDWLLSVGLAYSVYALTGSTLASAATLLSSFVPQVLVGSVAGVFVDRWDRKRTMVVTNLLTPLGCSRCSWSPARTGSGWCTPCSPPSLASRCSSRRQSRR